jgi:hypothetical protein
MDLPVDYTKLSQKERKLVREQYVQDQRGLCSHCGGNLLLSPPKEITEKKVNKKLFPIGFFKHPIHLHHSHDTGMTIGAVHNYCNAVLWQYFGE